MTVYDFIGKNLLVGVNYNVDTKIHECVIEEYRKTS